MVDKRDSVAVWADANGLDQTAEISVCRSCGTRSDMHIVEHSRPFWSVRIMHVECGWSSAAVGRRRHAGLRSVMVASTPTMFSGKVDFWVYNAHVACQCVVA